MKKKISIILVLAMIMSLTLSACGGSDKNAAGGEKVLKVAVGCSLTGTGAKAGTAFEEATKMAFEDIDYKGRRLYDRTNYSRLDG